MQAGAGHGKRTNLNRVSTHMTPTRRHIPWVAAAITSVSAMLLAAGGGASTRLLAQAPSAQETPQFEVASVKPNKTGDNRVMLGMQPGGRFTANNVSVRQLITNAYRLQSFQIVGGPGWLGTDRFDIVAKAAGDVPADQTQLMMRGLLAERFGLVAHMETREMPIYALVLAHSDGKLGPKMKPSTVDCEAMFAQGRGRGALPPPPTPGQPMMCGMRIGPGSVAAGGMRVAQFASSLSPMTGRVVQDKTDLAGRYDFEMSWTPDQGVGPSGPPRDTPAPPAGDAGASLFTSIQEQLGLKLESQRGPVDVLVIDNVHAPTPD